MPEGPEVRREADALAHALTRRVVTRCHFAFPHLKPFEREITGRRVTKVENRGKAMLIRFGDDLTIYSHNQLYGRWVVCPAGPYPSTGRSLRLAIENRRRSALLYSASDIEVLHRDELWNHPFLAKLGPDILDPGTTPRSISRRLMEKPFANRSLASLLLDQGFLAGVGNYLRSEILFDARLHPDRRPNDLDEAERVRLGKCVRRICRRTYRHRGVCTEPAHFRRRLREGERRGEARFHVYGRRNRPCRSCGSKVRRIERGSRALFHCPDCQT